MTTLRQVQDRSLSASVTHIALCPNMRLLAVALDANSIAVFAVFSTSWRRLATIAVTTSSSDEVISSVAWSPTGAHIVATTSQSRLLIYSVDRAVSAAASTRARRGARDTDPVSSLTLASPATAVLWADPLCDSVSPYENIAAALLPISLLSESRAQNNQQQSNTITPDSENDKVVERGFIFVGDANGYLTIVTSDLSFTVARTPVVSSAKPISRLHVTACGKRCVVISSDQDCDESTNENKDVVVRVVDLRFVRKFRHEIERVAQEIVTWNRFLKMADECVQQIETAWSVSMCDIFVKSIIRPLRQVMEQYAEDDGNVWDELYDVFCGARIKGSVLHFLNSNLGENGAKELLRSFEVYDNEEMEAFQKLVPLSENALSRASELRSLAHVSTRFEPVGLLVEDTESLFESTSKMYEELFLKGEELRVTSNEPSFFLYWIVVIARKTYNSRENTAQNDQLGGWEIQCILKFFEKMTRRAQKDTTPSDENIDTAAIQDEDKIDTGAIEESRVKAAFDVKLKHYVDAVRNHLKLIAQKPCHSVSAKIQVLASLTLQSWGSSSCCIYESIKDTEKSVTTVFTGDDDHNDELTIVRYRCSGKKGWSVRTVTLEGQNIRDAVTCDGERFAMVLENSTQIGEYNIELVSRSELGLGENDEPQLSKTLTLNRAQVTTVSLGNLQRRGNVNVVSNGKQKISGFHTTENQKLGIVSVLAKPKRVLLFDLCEEEK